MYGYMSQAPKEQSFSVIREKMETAFGGARLDALFASFDETPLSAGCVGQVHRAQIYGQCALDPASPHTLPFAHPPVAPTEINPDAASLTTPSVSSLDSTTSTLSTTSVYTTATTTLVTPLRLWDVVVKTSYPGADLAMQHDVADMLLALRAVAWLRGHHGRGTVPSWETPAPPPLPDLAGLRVYPARPILTASATRPAPPPPPVKGNDQMSAAMLTLLQEVGAQCLLEFDFEREAKMQQAIAEVTQQANPWNHMVFVIHGTHAIPS